MKIVEFKAEFLGESARILSLRHQRERTKRPELPEQFEQQEHALRALKTMISRENGSGVAAFRGPLLVGYLIGTVDADSLRERHVWIDYSGSAIAETDSAELYRFLYAAAARRWVELGAFKHYVLAPSGDPFAIDAWFRLGFGHEQVHAIKTLSDIPPSAMPGSDLNIRLAVKDDEREMRAMATLIAEHQTDAPVWAVSFPESKTKLRNGYARMLEDESADVWLALRDEQVIGFQAYFPCLPSEADMLVPDASIHLGIAGTLPLARKTGIGSTLTACGLAHAREAGYTCCTTDWRMTNLESSNFWPKQGFQPVAYRLFRQIDCRIAWADGRE